MPLQAEADAGDNAIHGNEIVAGQLAEIKVLGRLMLNG